MNLEDIKRMIEEKTGVPAALLNGKTPEENISIARTLLDLRSEKANEQKQENTAEKFKSWFDDEFSSAEDAARDSSEDAFSDIAEIIRIAAGGYPRAKDAGEISGLPDGMKAKDQFSEWFENQMSFDALK